MRPRFEVGSVAEFFEGFFHVLVEGAILGEGDAEVADVLEFGVAWLLNRRWGGLMAGPGIVGSGVGH
jgi:hypothetical protein